jgi:aubergine-like protein
LCQIDVSHRVLRTRNILETMMETRQTAQQQGKDVAAEIKKLVVSHTVITSYNERAYRIDDVDFSSTPLSTFEARVQGQSKIISYKDYLWNTYKVSVSNSDQPMLISKQIGPGGTERILLLVPELCLPTGLTDRMRSDFRFMKDLGSITISNPGPRIQKCTNLVKRIYENNECRTEMNTWGLKISDQPEKFTANKLNPGKILFNQGRTHDLASKSSFDRESQNGFYQTPSLQKWCIFYSNNDSRLKDTLMKELQAGFQRANWTNINEPLIVGVQGNDPNAWKNAIYQYQQAQFVLLLLPGFRGKDERGLYATCKRVLTSEVPIPSQVVLTGTIKSGKGITSIVSKVLTQMCAKIHGGEPWGLDNPEGLDEPTIVMGLDVYHGGANKKSIMALTGSLDRWVGR